MRAISVQLYTLILTSTVGGVPMPPQIAVLIPGVCGSTLVNQLSSRVRYGVWLTYQRLILGGMSMLELDAQGSQPENPSIVGKILPTGLLSAYYYTPYSFFSGLLKTYTHAYDWRLGNSGNGQVLASYLSNALKTNQVLLVCHSMGGLVARYAEAALRTDPNYANLTRIVLMGTPNFGSFEAAKNLAGIPTWLAPYAALIAKSPAGNVYNMTVSYLSRVIAHYRSVMELMPDGWRGPWQGVASVLAMYQLSSWNVLNSQVNQFLLDWGANSHQQLPEISNPSLFLQVCGYGLQTSVNLNEGQSIGNASEYHYSDQGDGVVPLLSAQLPAVQTISAQVAHAALPRSLPVLNAVWSALTGQSTGNIVVS